MYRREAAAYLGRLPKVRRERVLSGIEKLAEEPPPPGLDVKALKARPAYRLRVGPIRVIFERRRAELILLVLLIRSRGDVYKR